MITVFTTNSRSEDSLQSVLVCSISSTFFWFRGEQTLKWFSPLQCKHNLPYAGNYTLGRQPLQNLHFLIMSFDFSLGASWWALRFLIIFWRSAADWVWRISQACFRVSAAACPALMALEMVKWFFRKQNIHDSFKVLFAHLSSIKFLTR